MLSSLSPPLRMHRLSSKRSKATDHPIVPEVQKGQRSIKTGAEGSPASKQLKHEHFLRSLSAQGLMDRRVTLHV